MSKATKVRELRSKIEKEKLNCNRQGKRIFVLCTEEFPETLQSSLEAEGNHILRARENKYIISW